MESEALPLWTKYLQAFGVVAIAAIAAWVAWKQMLIARTKLQIELYEKRRSVFEAARKFLARVAAQASATDQDIREYTIGTADAVFLFDDDVAKYLHTIRSKAIQAKSLREVADPLSPGEEKANYVKEAFERLTWLGDQLDSLVETFKPWLALEQRSSRIGAKWWK